MAQKIVQGNEALASKIKFRRNELGLTIEEAASRLSNITSNCFDNNSTLCQPCRQICMICSYICYAGR